MHPRSGAGNIKDDGSSADEVMEVKNVEKTHTLSGLALDVLLRRAIRQGKEPVYIVRFAKSKVEATIYLKRTR